MSIANGCLNMNRIAEFYGKWIKSDPFDMGGTIRNGLGCLRKKPTAAEAHMAADSLN